MTSKRIKYLAALVVTCIAALWLMVLRSDERRSARESTLARAAPAARVADDIPSLPMLEQDAGIVTAELPRAEPKLVPTPLPPARAAKVDRVLAHGKYGEAHEQLGILRPDRGYDGDIYPPQGFAPLADGRLIVLDTDKKRLVWFGTDGRMERAQALPPELLLPADVVVARDGTIIVVDHEGVQTAGSVLFDPEGNVKARLPQMGGGDMIDVYMAGNDLYFSYGSITRSIKAGDTTGSASDEAPSVYDQAGIIPGRVAPDGRTVVHASVPDHERLQLLLSVITGERPDHVFSRLYVSDDEIRSLSHVDSDGAGIIYVVIDRRHGERFLLCFDGKTGDPIGNVPLPRDRSDGMPFSQFAVPEWGGLVMQQMERDGSIYRLIDCRP